MTAPVIRFRISSVSVICAVLLCVRPSASQKAEWICTSGTEKFAHRSLPDWRPFDGADFRVLALEPAISRQRIDGFGGCFNEKGWDALSCLSPEKRRETLLALFDGTDGCGFTLCRMPVGASDYAMDWYSLDDVPEDLEMKSFSLERDRKYLIPYIKAALGIRPDLKIWGSPWCPPAWMKANRHYACQGMEESSRLRREPAVLSAYALYLAKYVQSYQKEGIPVFAVHVQNEPFACQIFPSCLWTGEMMRDFIRDYLVPRFDEDRVAAEIWLGTINHGDVRAYADPVFADSVCRRRVAGVGYQWDGKWAAADTRRKYPDKKIWQTESECGDGANDMKAALYTFSLMKRYFDAGANAYFYWNMVLDESGGSTWGWKQNALVSVNRFSKSVKYNDEYFLMRHLSRFVMPGAVLIGASGYAEDAFAFANPDGSFVLLAANPGFTAREMTIRLGDRMIRVTVPEGSINTIVIKK
jgi:glucosylceramidase